MFHLSTQNMIKAFKFRAQAIFSLLEKTHTPGSQNLSSRNFFHFSTYISTQRSYIHQKLDTNSCFANLRAISNLCSFFDTPCRIDNFQIILIVHNNCKLTLKNPFWECQ